MNKLIAAVVLALSLISCAQIPRTDYAIQSEPYVSAEENVESPNAELERDSSSRSYYQYGASVKQNGHEGLD